MDAFEYTKKNVFFSGHNLGPHGLVTGEGLVPQPGMGIFAMMATVGTIGAIPVASQNCVTGTQFIFQGKISTFPKLDRVPLKSDP